MTILSGWLVACAAANSAPATAEVAYDELVRTYELGGQIQTRRDVWNAIRFDGAVGTTRANAIGTASWRVRPKWWWKRSSGGRCAIERVSVDVNVLIRVPDWHFAHRAAPHVRADFACVRDTVNAHERRHGEIARGIGVAVRDALMHELRDVPCGSVNARATEIYRRELRAGRVRQNAFDEADRRRNRYQRCNRISQPPKIERVSKTATRTAPPPPRDDRQVSPATNGAPEASGTAPAAPPEPGVPWQPVLLFGVVTAFCVWLVVGRR